MIRGNPTLLAVLLVVFSACSCDQLQQTQPKTESDSDLRITLGGFREGHPEGGELGGVCTPDASRTVINCDIYNGIVGWSISEVTLVVTWSPYDDDDKRFYAQSVSIDPLKTERVSILLGIQLPVNTQLRNNRGNPIGPPLEHWGWTFAQAKGHQVH